ncbi:MAG: antibiotic biosynthesis monooxygenase [Steroidobacteraceae bacterium]|jgi:autoinducer 2-degrading protein|nr:antibiotic biosynthesis monooxygenase [Steroidobacteraceae bacterium]
MANRLGSVTFIARMTVREGCEQQFLGLMQELAAHVHANEPGTVGYELYRLREPGRYAVLESFADETAAGVHANSAALQRLGPSIADCLVGTWELEYLDTP